MADLSGFDASTIEPSEFAVIPAGRYDAEIVDSEMCDNAAGTGSYLKLAFQIAHGEHKGRQLFERLNLNNPNETAVKIARAKLAAICRAVGIMTPKDSTELHGRLLILPVLVKKRSDNGEPGNEVGVCQPLVRGAAATQGSADKPTSAAPSTQSPW